MPISRPYYFLATGLTALVLAGCAGTATGLTPGEILRSTPSDQQAGQTADAAEKAAPKGKKPAAKSPAPGAQLSPELLYQLLTAEVAGQRGQLELALRHYLAAARQSHDTAIVERATRIAVYARDDAAALEMAELWSELAPDLIDPYQVIAAMNMRQGNIAKAKAALERVLNQGGQNQEKFLLVTSLLSKEKDKQVALKVMEDLIASRQNDPDALYAYSQLATLVGELNKARNAAEKVCALRPDKAEAHILLSNIMIRQGMKNEAMDYLQTVLQKHPSVIGVRQHYARRLVDEKRYVDAQAQYKLLLQESPDSQEVHYALGLLALQTRDFADAETHFKALISRNQMVSESSYYLGQIAESRDQLDAAIEAYRLVSSGQHYVEAQIRIALIEVRRGQLADARKRLQDIQPDSAEMEVRLLLAEGELLREAKQYPETFEFFNEAVGKQPDNTQLLYARALAAEKIDRIDVTIGDLQNIIKREANNSQALNALGYTLVDRTEKVQEGLGYIQKAHKLQPDDPAIIDSLGWAYYRLGNYDEALKYLRAAFDKLKDAEIAAHLGEVLWVIGEKDAARTIWDEALRETPSHKLLLDVIKRFTK